MNRCAMYEKKMSHTHWLSVIFLYMETTSQSRGFTIIIRSINFTENSFACTAETSSANPLQLLL
jgi:hypothetical protein